MRDYTEYEDLHQAKTADSNNATKTQWLLIGLGIGAGAALLLAPIAGRDLRGLIAHGCSRALKGIGSGVSRGTRELRAHGSSLLNFNRHQAS